MGLDTANSLLTVTTFQSHYGAPTADTSIVEDYIDAASGWMNKSTGRKLKSRTLTEYYDVVDPYELILREYPITSVTTLHNDTGRSFGSGSLIASTQYEVEKERGTIIMTETILITGRRVAKVVYVAGYSTIPPDLANAAMTLAAYWYDKFANKSISWDRMTTESREITYKKDLPKEVMAAAADYARHA